MEGLLLAGALRELEPRLPASRGAWRFPDARTAVLPLDDAGALWIWSRPPNPRLAFRAEGAALEPPHTPFQTMLYARAVGPLQELRQHRLDRVVELTFAAAEGFVPSPAVTLVAELTGRNANLLLLDGERRIIGVERVVLHERNRYRQLTPGVAYVPPPPYHKVDPRGLSVDELLELLRGKRLRDVRKLVDGIGPQLASLVQVASGVAPEAVLEGDPLARVVDALRSLCEDPQRMLAEVGDDRGLAEVRRQERREHALSRLRPVLRKRLELANKRVRDAHLALAGEADVARIRGEADLLMAYASQVPGGAERVTLDGFDGQPVEFVLDPREDARANARRRYERARKRQGRAERAKAQLPTLTAEFEAAERELQALDLREDEALLRQVAELEPRQDEKARAAPIGIRFHDARGFEVVVGRNARENDQVTFKVARSRDLWLHVQGSPGSHVIVRSQDRPVPFETVLFAARLAAGFSPARHSDNVAVDYTLRKNVWKVKGLAAGAVHFTQHKTVFVRPARDAVRADEESEVPQG